MLNNPKWDNIFSVESLISWLESKDPSEHYVYTCNTGCVLFQYFTEKGMDIGYIDSRNYTLLSAPDVVFTYPYVLNQIAYGDAASHFENRNTFGAALERARHYSLYVAVE